LDLKPCTSISIAFYILKNCFDMKFWFAVGVYVAIFSSVSLIWDVVMANPSKYFGSL
jgi:hypothetical protein